MAGTSDEYHVRSAATGDAAASSAWPAVDLRAALALLPVSRTGSGPTNAAAAWSTTAVSHANGALVLSLGDAPAATASTGARRRRREHEGAVPVSAFVCIGRMAAPTGDPDAVPLGAAKAPTANDNFFAPNARKSLWRELFFLTLLAVTLAGVFWTGRMHAYQKVIVVPGPSSYRSVVT